jgi:tetratricopeptide (TPR) repeat protein
MLVLLIPFMVMGINSQIAYIRERRRKCIILYACTVLVFFMVEYFPVEGSDDLSAYYNTHAIILNSLGLEEEAMRYWEKSSDMKKPSSACADYALAVKHIMKGDMDGASRYLDQINEGSFFAAPKYELIGDVMMNQGKIDTGLSAYDRSLEINSGQRRVRMKRVAILGRIDKQRALLEQEKLEYIQSFYGKIQGP